MAQSFRNKNILSHVVREFETLNFIYVLKKNGIWKQESVQKMIFENRNQSKKMVFGNRNQINDSFFSQDKNIRKATF